jgi:hypothetical protein
MGAVARFGRAAFAPFAATAVWYERTAKAHPLTTAIITTGFKTTAADLFAQKVSWAVRTQVTASNVT